MKTVQGQTIQHILTFRPMGMGFRHASATSSGDASANGSRATVVKGPQTNPIGKVFFIALDPCELTATLTAAVFRDHVRLDMTVEIMLAHKAFGAVGAREGSVTKMGLDMRAHIVAAGKLLATVLVCAREVLFIIRALPVLIELPRWEERSLLHHALGRKFLDRTSHVLGGLSIGQDYRAPFQGDAVGAGSDGCMVFYWRELENRFIGIDCVIRMCFGIPVHLANRRQLRKLTLG